MKPVLPPTFSHRLALLFAGLWLIPTALAASSAELQLYSVEAPPLTSTRANEEGLIGEVLQHAAKQEGLVLNVITDTPWPRAQRIVQEQHNLLIAPLSRTPERENHYQWLSSVYTMPRAFFTLKEPVNSLADAKQLTLIGVGLGSAQVELLLNAGFRPDQLLEIPIDERMVYLLERGRVDAWFNGVPEALYFWKHYGQSNVLIASPEVLSTEQYLACSRHCDDPNIARLQRRIERMQHDGSLQRIQAKYRAYTQARPNAYAQ